MNPYNWPLYLLAIPLAILTALPCYFMLNLFLTIKPGLRAKICMIFGCITMVHMVIFIGDPVNLFPSFIIFLGCVCLSFQGGIYQRLAIAMIFSTFGFALSALNDNYVNQYHDNIAFYLAFRVISWIIAYLLTRHYAPERDCELSDSLWKLVIFLSFPPLGIVLSVVLLTIPYDVSYQGSLMTYLILLIIAQLSVVGLFWAIRVLTHQQKLEQQTVLGEMNRRYYDTLEQQQFEVRRLKHDMANHLRTLAALPPQQQSDYLKELVNTPVFGQRLNYCGDSTVNAVLNSKEERIKGSFIAFHPQIDIPGELTMDKSEVCAIFANALDNAIEACEHLPASQREIRLEARCQKGLLVLNVTNPYRQLSKSPLPFTTTKKDKKNHGYGLRSIREIVLRHGGNLELKEADGIFTLFLYIKCGITMTSDIRSASLCRDSEK